MAKFSFFHDSETLAKGRGLLATLGLVALFSIGCGSQFSADSGSSLIVEATDQTFEQEVLRAKQPVLVDMWAPWCGPCVEMKPALHDVAGQLEGEFKVVALNVEENPHIDRQYQVNSLPTLMIFKDGELVERSVGGRSAFELMELVRPHRRAETP